MVRVLKAGVNQLTRQLPLTINGRPEGAPARQDKPGLMILLKGERYQEKVREQILAVQNI